MFCKITTNLFVVVCLVLMLAVTAFANDLPSDNVKSNLTQPKVPNSLDSARSLGEFLTPDGRFDLEAARRSGYQGSLDLKGFESAIDPATGQPVFRAASSASPNEDPDDAYWQPLGSGMNGSVYALTVYDGKLIAGGDFTTAGGVAASRIASWNGSSWSPLGSGMDQGVIALTVYDGKLIAGGPFVQAGGVTAYHIASWNGAQWDSLRGGLAGTAGNVDGATMFNGDLVAGGKFCGTSGGPYGYWGLFAIASWNGTEWDSLGSGMGNCLINYVSDLTVYDGRLIAGGGFTTAGGVAASRIASWNGSSWSPLGSGMNNSVWALTVYEGKLIAGGGFTTAGGVAASRIASWNGSGWSPLGSGMNGSVSAVTAYEGKLIAGGAFTTAGGVAASRIASWNGSGWSPLGSGMAGMDGGVHALTVYDHKLIAGGDFTMAGNEASAKVASWKKITPTFIVLGLFDWYGNLSGESLREWLTNQGYGFVYVVENLEPCGVPGEDYYSGNAKHLADFIDSRVNDIWDSYGIEVTSIDLVGHSMGGLIARRYASPKADEQTNWTPKNVRNLIMLGTPNKGSNLANIASLEWLKWISFKKCQGTPPVGYDEWPAFSELSIHSMMKFNEIFYDNPLTQYYAFWGERGKSSDCYNGGAGRVLLAWPNDGAVSRNSAVRDHRVWWLPGFHPSYEKCHGENWCHSRSGNPTYNYLEDENFFVNYLKPILDGADWNSLPKKSTVQDDSSLEMPPQIAYESILTVPTGGVSADSFFVEANSDLTVVAYMSDSLMSLSLRSPSGMSFDSTLSSLDSTQMYFTDTLGMHGFNFNSASEGYWAYTVDARLATSSPARFLLRTALQNSVIASGRQNLEVLTGQDTLLLNVSVTDNGTGVTGLSVTALPIWKDQDTAALISFFDDGLHVDGSAADGNYGAIIMPSESGAVEYAVAVSGMTPSGSINRYLSFYALSESSVCGDANGDAVVDIADAVYLISYIFKGGPAPNPEVAGDANCDTAVDIADAVYLISYIFKGGPAPCAACK